MTDRSADDGVRRLPGEDGDAAPPLATAARPDTPAPTDAPAPPPEPEPEPELGPKPEPGSGKEPRKGRARRRAVLGGLAAAGVGAAAWTRLVGGERGRVVPAPPPRRTEEISAKDAGGFADIDESFAASGAPPAPTTTAPPPPTLVYPTASEAAAAAEVTVPTILATDDPVLHLLRRAAFGPTPALVDEVHAVGIDAWLNRQLDASSVPDPVGEMVWAAWPRSVMAAADIQRSQETFAWDTMFEYGQATMARQVWSSRQVYEVMVDFWANHLNVTTPGEGAWDVAPSWHNDVIRRHALGSFTDMLLAANRHPAMLRYLTNDDSRKDAVNENLGRELLELHTVGVQSGYTEEDVRNSAYILTGRSVVGEMDERGQWGDFIYDAEVHWTGPVRVLDFTHPNDSAAGGLDVGDAYLRYLASHPATGQTLARKLAVRLVSDNPPQELVDRMAAAYIDGGTEVVPMLDVLFRSVEFWAAVGQKTRRPLENVVATARILDVRPGGDTRAAIEDHYWSTAQMGHRPLAWPAPNGYPDVTAAWGSVSGLLMVWNVHRGLVAGWNEGLTYTPAAQLVAADAPRATLGEYVDSLCRRLCYQTFQPPHRDALLAFVGASADTPIADAHVEDRIDLLAALVLDSPYFALR